MQDSVMPASDADEFGLIDLLIAIVDNIKLLIVAPVLVALCAWAYTMNQPLVYESTSLLRLRPSPNFNAKTTQDLIALQSSLYESALQEFTSSDVLAILMESPDAVKFLSSKALAGEAPNNQLRKLINPVFDKKAGLLKLSTRAAQAGTAQELNQKLVEAFIKYSLPKGHDLESLNAQILQNQASIKLLEAEILKNQNSKADAQAISELVIQLVKRLERLQELQNQSKGFGREIYVQLPSTPESGIHPNQKIVVYLSFFVALFLIFIFILIRLTWTNFSNNPHNAEKAKRLRRSLGLTV